MSKKEWERKDENRKMSTIFLNIMISLRYSFFCILFHVNGSHVHKGVL